MRYIMQFRYDRSSYEYLSKESLWSCVECIYFATNYEMTKNNLYKEEYWLEKYKEIKRKYEVLFLDLCIDDKLIAHDKAGRFGKRLNKKEYIYHDVIEDEDGDVVEVVDIIENEGVFFYKVNILDCLKEHGFDVDPNDLWASVEEKEKVLRPEQEARLIVQGIGIALRAQNTDMTIADMARHELVKKAVGGMFVEKTLRGWLSEVDDRSPDQKTGPKPKTL